MASISSGTSVANFTPKPHQLLTQIRKAAADSKMVGIARHTEERMDERGITILDALRVLRTGEIVGDIKPGKFVGEWKCKVVAKKKGSREIGVATVVLKQGRLLVATVEWEDQ